MSNMLKRAFAKFSSDTGEQVHTDEGHEIPDPTPMAPPVGYKAGPTLREQIRAMIAEASKEAESAGYESLEEADDFDVGDDYEPSSGYEIDDNLPEIAELKRRKDEDEKKRKAPLPPKPKKTLVAPDQGASGIDELSSEIEGPEGPEAAS